MLNREVIYLDTEKICYRAFHNAVIPLFFMWVRHQEPGARQATQV